MKRIYKDNVALLLCIRRTGYGRELLLKTSRKLLALILALGVGTLTAGCSGSEQPTELTLANIGWDENVALSNLTKVLLEEELGYESVEVHTSDLDSAY